MDPHEVVDRVLSENVWVPLLVACATVAVILIRTVGGVMKSSAREKTRREIAAYIAEGTMSPEHGEKLMKAGKEEA